MKKLFSLILVLIMAMALAGCETIAKDTGNTCRVNGTPGVSEDMTQKPKEKITEDSSLDVQEDITEEKIQDQSVIYIGMDEKFSEYTFPYNFETFGDNETADLYLESLVDEMGTLTGWDLDCDISIYKTVSVAFADESTLFVGPPMEQKEEFHMFDAESLVQTVLDSVKKTIQMNLGAENTDLVEVYFSTESYEELVFPNINMYVPLEEAYTGLIPIED